MTLEHEARCNLHLYAFHISHGTGPLEVTHCQHGGMMLVVLGCAARCTVDCASEVSFRCESLELHSVDIGRKQFAYLYE